MNIRRGAPVHHILDFVMLHRHALEVETLVVAVIFGHMSGAGIEEAEYRSEVQRIRAELDAAQQLPSERRVLAAIRLAQDSPKAWDVARPERRRQLVWAIFDSVKVSDGRVVSVRRKPSIAPLLALRVEKRGPDRIRDRGIAPVLFGLPVTGIEHLLAVTRAFG
jgi:hypothetical protein